MLVQLIRFIEQQVANTIILHVCFLDIFLLSNLRESTYINIIKYRCMEREKEKIKKESDMNKVLQIRVLKVFLHGIVRDSSREG